MSKTADPIYQRGLSAFLRHLSGVSLAVLLLAGPLAQATVRTDPYQVTVPMTDRSEGAHTAAFEAAMRTVLVRVTGRRSAGEDAALAPLIGEARRFVQQYRPAADNQLTVAFDGKAIDRWLVQNGQPIWGRDRPATFVWLALPPAGAQVAMVVKNDDTSDQKDAVDAEASLRGIPLRWPNAAELQAHHIDYAAVVNSSNATLADLGQRLGGDAVLIGRPVTNNGVTSIRWAHQFQDSSGEFGAAAEGVDGVADLYAGLYAASGSPTAVDVEIGGLVDVTAYAKVQTYLESLAFVSHVSVRSLNADRALFRLTVRGGAGALQRAIAGNGSLESLAATDGSVLRFTLRK
jgi:hypothetical protein